MDLLPVRAFHPNPLNRDAARLVAPVYDTLGPEDHRRLDGRPHNAATFTSRPSELPVPEFLDRAMDRLSAALSAGAFVQDPSPALYVYAIRFRPPPDIVESLEERQRRPDYLLLGIVGALPPGSTSSPQIAPHERTFDARVEERVQLTERTRTHFAPIMAGYDRGDHQVNDLVESYLGVDRRGLSFDGKRPPLVDVELDGTTHRLWRIDDHEVEEKLRELLRPHRLLILDGHHRFTAAARLQSRGVPVHPLTVLVEARDKALLLLPWHRVLPPSVMTYRKLLSLGRSHFPTVEELPSQGGVEAALRALRGLRVHGERGFVAAGAQGTAIFRTRESSGEGGDYEALHRFLEEELHLDPSGFSFVRSVRSAMEAVQREQGVACLLPPLSFEGVEREAFAHRVMAQKSTMFLPKVAEGVIFAPAMDGN